MKYEKFDLGKTIEIIAKVMRVISIVLWFVILLTIYGMRRALG
jgi:hypothetical protein